MKVLLSNAIIDVTKSTQAICNNNDKRITIIDSNSIFDIFPVTSEELKNDFKKIVKAVKRLCDNTLKVVESEQETNKKD